MKTRGTVISIEKDNRHVMVEVPTKRFYRVRVPYRLIEQKFIEVGTNIPIVLQNPEMPHAFYDEPKRDKLIDNL